MGGITWHVNACEACAQHIANGECGNCHDRGLFAPGHAGWHDYRAAERCPGCVAYRRAAEDACPTAVRMERRMRGAWLTLDCPVDEDGDEQCPGFSWSGCGVCGDDSGGDRHRVAVSIPDPRTPTRRIVWRGLPVTVEPCLDSAQLFAVVTFPDGGTRAVWAGHYGGHNRYRDLARMLAEVTAERFATV